VMFALGDIWKLLGRWDQAEQLYRQLLAIATALHDSATAARAWSDIGDVQSSNGNHQEALISSEYAEAFAMREDSPLLHVKVLLRKGWILSYCGQIRTALEVSNRTIDLSATLGDKRMLALSLKLRGYMYVLLGQTAQADADFNQALRIHRRLDDKEDVGRILNVLGENARMRGEYAQAVELYQTALVIGRELRHPERIIMYLSNLGGAQAGLGEYAQALVLLREALNLAQTATWYGMPETNRFLAEAYLGLGDYQEALRAASAGLEQARAARLVLDVGGNLRVLGQIAPHLPPEVRAAEALDARACFAEALHIHGSIGARAEEARTMRAWAYHELRHGDPAQGAERLAKARALFERLGMSAELERMDQEAPATRGLR
ncbi:MAG TPA: tetratricopeptide repeat protein, partial [Herpetosiphonaceae bacterium]|nr:tetratricopeptide repeat protein [Herpetosiphonaceae bacterium]